MLLDACECVLAATRVGGPVVAHVLSAFDVLDQHARHAVCTGVQCFASDADAFAMVPVPAPTTDVAPFVFTALMPLVVWAVFRSGRSK